MEKKCNKCGLVKKELEFGAKQEGRWIRQPCLACKALRMRKNRKKPEVKLYQAEYAKRYRIKNEEKLKARFVEWRVRVKNEVFSHYSKGIPKCICCKESHIEFLSIDHMNGGGKKHFIELNRRGVGFYVWLRKNNYPSGFQIMCMNCNFAKGHYGRCPHKEKKIITTIK